MSGVVAGKCQEQCKEICWYINKLVVIDYWGCGLGYFLDLKVILRQLHKLISQCDLMCFVPLYNQIEVRCCSREENWRRGLEQSNLFSIPLDWVSVEHSSPPYNFASCPWPKNHIGFLWVDAAPEQHESLQWWRETKRCACTLWCTTLVLDRQLVWLHNWIENDGNSNQLSSKILSRHHVMTKQGDGWHAAHRESSDLEYTVFIRREFCPKENGFSITHLNLIVSDLTHLHCFNFCGTDTWENKARHL